MRADRDGSNAGELYETLWSPFETSFWSEEQRRGRLRRPRLEWFMQTALQAQLGDDIDIGRLYVGYRRFATGGNSPLSATNQLQILSVYSEHYRQLLTGMGDAPIARFGRDTAAWDASTTHPLALAIAVSSSSSEEQASMFNDIASYLVRRAVCGVTTKNYNKVFIQQLKRLVEAGVGSVPLRAALAGLDGDASRWPRDEEFRRSWLDGPLYPGRLDGSKAKWLLARLERGLRSLRTEEPLPLALETLDVDHVLPSSWFEYWPLPDARTATEADARVSLLASFSEQPLSDRHSAIRRREVARVRMGNLTLLHYGVNRGLQNHSFIRKREKLFEESNLHLNRELMRLDAWDEDAIDRRGRELFDVACKLWPGPS